MIEGCHSCPFFKNGVYITWKPDLASSEGECNAPTVARKRYCCYSTTLLFLSKQLVSPKFVDSFYRDATNLNGNVRYGLGEAILDHYRMLPRHVEAADDVDPLLKTIRSDLKADSSS